MPLFVSMYFKFKLDTNANFTMQNGEWVLLSMCFFLLSTHLTPKERYVFICYYIMPFDCATYFLNNT